MERRTYWRGGPFKSMNGLYYCPATTYSPTHFRAQYNGPEDECPFPTLAAAARSARGNTRLHYAVHLCAVLGIRCTGRSRTV